MPERTTCPVCGTDVEIISSDDGTSHYRPMHEHPADDSQPVTEEFLREMGFNGIGNQMSIGLSEGELRIVAANAFYDAVEFWNPDDGDGESSALLLFAAEALLTRGDLRRLIAALKGE